MKILITGHLGLLGSACVDLFHDKGWEVVGIDNNARSMFFSTEKQQETKKAQNYCIDLRDASVVEEVFKEHQFDAIIHSAAQPSHDYATEHVLEDFDVNARATVILLEAARKHCNHVPIVFVSTDKVYGENMREMITYDGLHIAFNEKLGLDFAGDRSFFGCSKAAADMYAQQYAARFGMKIGIFRPGCITGKNHQGAEQHGFLAYLTKCIREGKTYTIYGNGKQVRDQIHANDLAEAFAHFIENPSTGAVYNIGGGPERAVSVLEAGELLSKALNKPFKYVIDEERKGDRRWDVHDVSKFKADYPLWDYKYDLPAIINDITS